METARKRSNGKPVSHNVNGHVDVYVLEAKTLSASTVQDTASVPEQPDALNVDVLTGCVTQDGHMGISGHCHGVKKVFSVVVVQPRDSTHSADVIIGSIQ